MTNTNYMRVGRWSKCEHCGGIHAGHYADHYCGAPWQTAQVGDLLDDVPTAWAAECADRLASAPRTEKMRKAVEHVLDTAIVHDTGTWLIASDSLNRLRKTLRRGTPPVNTNALNSKICKLVERDTRAAALALCEEWETAQNHHPWCEVHCGSEDAAGGPLRCTCGHAHRLEAIGCRLADALRAALAAAPSLDRETLAREIALHIITLGGGYDGRDCSCGALWPQDDTGTLAAWRARHLADVVLSRLARGAAEPSDEDVARELAKEYARRDNLRVLARHRDAAMETVRAVNAARERAAKEGTNGTA